MRSRINLLWLLFLLGACATPTPQLVRETVIVTATPQPTHAPIPTYTPYPTLAPQDALPTYTPLATYTPYPTYTLPPTPTNTPTVVQPTSTPPPTDTPTLVPSTPTPVPPTATPKPQGEVLILKASRGVYDQWMSWKDRYVFYAHKEAGIREVRDLRRLEIYEAIFNSDGVPFNDDQIVDGVNAVMHFCFAIGGCDVFPLPNSKRDTYMEELLGHWNRVGFMTLPVADYFQFETNEQLVRIEFELEP
jgi:hypothetical protein